MLPSAGPFNTELKIQVLISVPKPAGTAGVAKLFFTLALLRQLALMLCFKGQCFENTLTKRECSVSNATYVMPLRGGETYFCIISRENATEPQYAAPVLFGE